MATWNVETIALSSELFLWVSLPGKTRKERALSTRASDTRFVFAQQTSRSPRFQTTVPFSSVVDSARAIVWATSRK